MENEEKDALLNDSAALNFLGTMKRYPFNGRSKYLIDKFFIIGYDYPTLNKILIKNNLDFIQNSSKNIEEEIFEKNRHNELPQEFEIKEPPSLINVISSDFSKEVLDIDIIIEMIFPNKPKFFYVEEDLDLNNEGIQNNIPKNVNDKINEMRRSKTNFTEENKINNEQIFNTFPNNKSKIFENKNIKKDEYIPRSYNVIFSSNPQSGGNSKKSINGFAHVFYKKFTEKKITNNSSFSFFIPIVFCIISEYPYYNSYYRLTKQIMLLFKKDIIEVPIEFTIQNIVNFTLSPINDDVILNISQISLINLWDTGSANINSIKEEEEEKENDKIKEIQPFSLKEPGLEDISNEKQLNKNEKINENQSPNKSDKKKPRNSNINKIIINDNNRTKSPKNIKPKTLNNSKLHLSLRNSHRDKRLGLKVQIDFLNKISSNSPFVTKFMKNEEESTIKFEPIKFPFLQGYPLIQFNLSKVLLDNLSPYDVIIIFIYTFLEKDVLFFSNNLELLSLTINSYQNLNFPLNDEKYYFINACVSYDNYIKGNSTFVGSAFTTMVGINELYQPKYINSSTHKLKEHLAIDLDNGNVYQVKDPNNKETSTKNKTLFDFIKKICKNKEIKEEKESINILSNNIRELNDELNKCKDIILNNEFKDYSIIEYNKDIHYINLEIQESFYRFINNICIYFYQNLTIQITTASLKKPQAADIVFDGTYSSHENYTIEERCFLDELKDTMKFESFIFGFIQSYNPIDLYKIPLTFTEEFVSILSRKSSMQLKNIKFLALFENLYRKIGRIDIDFHPFVSKYFVQYKEKFDRDIQDYYIEQKESKNKFNLFDYINDKKAFNFKYKWYELDNNLILNYFNLLKNLDPEEYDNLFHFPLLNLEQNNIKDVLISDIENGVEKYAIEANILSKSEICCGNILLLFTITLKLFRSSVDIQSFLSNIFHGFIIFRKYYTIVMNMVYRLMEECIKKKDYSHAKNFLLCYYPCINSINEFSLIPNENLMNTIKKFNLIDIDDLMEKANKDEGTFNTPVREGSKSIIKKEINYNNLYVCYNFNINGTISEDKIIYEINNDIKKYNNKFCKNCMPKIRYRMGNKIIDSEIYSQLQILEMLTKEYNLFNKDLDIEKINSKILFYASINIFIFIRNNKDLSDKYEIIDIIKTIFYIYLEKYIEKETKEKKDKENANDNENKKD